MEDLQLDDLLSDSFLDDKQSISMMETMFVQPHNKWKLEEWCEPAVMILPQIYSYKGTSFPQIPY